MKMNIDSIGISSMRTRYRLVENLMEQGIRNFKVLDCFTRVPRHQFVDEAFAYKVYDSVSLPIGHAQYLSKPYVVAKMLELVLEAPYHEHVLEIGTGSGFQAAALSYLVDQVFSVECIASLKKRAEQRLRKLDRSMIQLRHADGHFGWVEHAPYDVIIVNAAVETPPMELLAQLIPDGGRLIIPVGGQSTPLLTVYETKGSEVQSYAIEEVTCLPMLSGVK